MFMSDIAGQDIDEHRGDVNELIAKVRAFLNSTLKTRPLPSPAIIASEYDAFNARLPEICAGLKLEADALEYKAFTWIVANFVSVVDGG
jgi:hypothetical protein